MNKRLAFTLIELLVVIAVIGILSGLIVVSMSGTTDKAMIAKSQVFSNSLRNALMSDMIAEWKLDGNTNDSWGSFNGTISSTVNTSTDCVYGTCYNFAGGYINFGSVASLGETTVALWFKSTDTSTTRSLFSFNGSNRGGFHFNFAASNYPLLYLASSHYRYFGNISKYFDNKWHFLVVYIAGGAVATDILNSSLKIDTVTISNGSTSSGTAAGSWSNFYLGWGEGSVYNGSIDEVRIFRDGIVSFQIEEMYYSGLNQLLSSGEINQDEYLSRINSVAINE